MKLTTFIIILFLVQVSAASKAQITLNENKTPLATILEKIGRQSGYDFIYSDKDLKGLKVNNIQLNNVDLEKALETCFKGQPLAYNVADRTVMVTKKEPSLIDNLKEKVKETLNLFRADSVVFRGTVVDEKGLPMPGATVRVKGKKTATKSKEDGGYSILAPIKGALVISFIGYKDQEITLLGLDEAKLVNVMMQVGQDDLEEVTIASNGYQDIPKERSTGSFEIITGKQLQHSNDPNLLRRLEGLTTSMDFGNQFRSTNSALSPGRQNAISALTIRGKNTLTSLADETGRQVTSGEVLVVIDGIPNPYPIDNVNPNDVETITILKDAAAASIWGSRAANGVIVIKTKKGGYERPVTVSFNSNFNVTEKPDLFYRKLMSTSDLIDAEIYYYNSRYRPSNPSSYLVDPTSPIRTQRANSLVFEIMNDWKKSNGALTVSERDARLDALRGNDVRRDLSKYFYRNAVQQSYSLGIDGGSKTVAYRLSGGYDHVMNNTQGAGNDRLSLNYSTSVKPLKNLELSGNLGYVLTRTRNQDSPLTGGSYELMPYTRLVNEQGDFLAIPYLYRPIFKELLKSTYGDKLLDYDYVPLADLKESHNNSRDQTINLNVNARYAINSFLSANVTYNFGKGLNTSELLKKQTSFYMRNLINYYTDPNTFNRGLQLGDLYQPQNSNSTNQVLRGQLNLNKDWGSKHSLSAIVGLDVGQFDIFNRTNTYYGYDEETLRYQQYGNDKMVPTLYNNSEENLPGIPLSFRSGKNRTLSSFLIAAYTYNQKYTLSGSMRRDGSSDLGRGTNKSGTPFYSIGASWNIANESFYHWTFLPKLQLRATFGYNGNVSPLISSNAQIEYARRAEVIGDVDYAFTPRDGSVTNKLLRPERTGVTNIGLDFGFRNNQISGSLEYYDKRTSDLMAIAPVDPTTGFERLTYNIADLHGWGTEFTLNTVNLSANKFSWNSNFLFSYNRVKVTELFSDRPDDVITLIHNLPNYNKGYDLHRLFAYSWGGLDPETGDPRGILNGQPVRIDNTQQGMTNLMAIELSPGSSSSVQYFGSSVPVYFGSLRNTFGYSGFTISVSLLYKLGYYFRNSNAVKYHTLFFQNGIQSVAYNERWQKPGDEKKTNVPSLTFPTSENRDNFYQLSAANVHRADHVRLQEVNLGYQFANKNLGFIKKPRLYFNLPTGDVILWRANKIGIDPETADLPRPKIYSIGFSGSF